MAAALLVLLQVEIIAHRGASAEAPENTLAAFRLGWLQGDACELDVHLSKDGQIVVLHDATTKRTTGVDKPVAEQTVAELQALDAGSGERIPTLKQVLDLLPEKKRLYIEIKCGPEILPELQRTLDGFPAKKPQLAIIGFGYDTMAQAKKVVPGIPVYWLSSSKKAPPLDDLIVKCRAAGLDGLDLHHEFPIDKDFVAKVHAAGLKLITWTVNDPEIATREAAAGVDGITTDRPKAMRQKLSTPK